jgi:hypothetical protein
MNMARVLFRGLKALNPRQEDLKDQEELQAGRCSTLVGA